MTATRLTARSHLERHVHAVVILVPTTSSLTRVAGVPLAQRAVLSALRAGFERIVLLTGDEGPRVRALVVGDPRTGDAPVEVRDHFDVEPNAEVAVVPGDILVTPAALAALGAAVDDGPTVVSVDGHPVLARCRGLDLGSMSARDDGRGVTLRGGDAADVFAALRRAGARETSLGDAICMPITDRRAIVAAEAALCARLRADSAATDGVLARWIDRPLSCRVSRWIVAHTGLRPNAVTGVGTAIGLTGGLFLARGTYASGIVGTALFLAAAIVDGCDGEVARLTFRESAFGQKLDVATDNVVHLAIFLGLAIGLHRRDPDGHVAALAALLLGGFVLDGALSYYFLVVRTDWRGESGAARSWQQRLRRGVLNALEALMNRDFAYILVLLAIADRLHWFLWGAAIGSYVFAALFLALYRAGSGLDSAAAT